MSDRYSDDVSGNELREGDRIDPRLVARTPGQYGGRVAADPESPKTQMFSATQIRGMDDVYSAILVDPETGTLARASRHSSNSAWSQAEYDWKVKEVGSSVSVEEAEIELQPEGEEIESEREYVSTWLEILFDEAKSGRLCDDEIRLTGRSIRVYDPFGPRKAHASISLE